MPVDDQDTKTCELCGRRASLSFHHLIPRTVHSNKWFKKRFTREEMSRGLMLCRACHKFLHVIFDHKELGRTFNTREALLEHDKVRRWIAWARKRD